jgi:hypothetical protein
MVGTQDGVYQKDEKPRFNKFEMHGDLSFEKGTVVSASTKRQGGALYKFPKK